MQRWAGMHTAGLYMNVHTHRLQGVHSLSHFYILYIVIYICIVKSLTCMMCSVRILPIQYAVEGPGIPF